MSPSGDIERAIPSLIPAVVLAMLPSTSFPGASKAAFLILPSKVSSVAFFEISPITLSVSFTSNSF